MVKRKRTEDEKLEKYAKKIKKIEEKKELERLREMALKSIAGASNKQLDADHDKENNSAEANGPTSNDSDEKSTETDEEHETDENWLKIIGDDPKESKALKMQVREDLVKRWQFISREGNSKEMKDLYEQLDKKYECVKEMLGPKMNQQVASAMKESAVSRDKYILESQNIAAKAVSIIGSLMTALYEDPENMELEMLLGCLSDTARLLSFQIFKNSRSRKAFVEPGLSKETVAVLKETKIDEFLYGEQLSEKLKEAKAITKLADSMKSQAPSKANSSTQKKQPLNAKFPFSRRPGQTGFTPTGGRPKQKQFSKNKQQFVNHNAQTQAQRPVTQKQDKTN